MRLDDAQRLDWLRLIRSEGIGPRTFRALVNRFGGASAALAALPDLARSRGRRVRVATAAEAEREFRTAGRLGVRFVALGEDGYPMTLRAVDDAPPLLAVRGSADAIVRPAIAIVGSRNASAVGRGFAEQLARALGREGFVVVSGLARGIDASAHAAATASGTVAVLAGGHDRVYPAENVPLLDALLAAGGAAVSEMPLGWEPRAKDFPRRNRLVSGLSYGVVVVEAARRSGSLITARLALEQGREVFAVPGSPMDPRAEGTNDLIRQGATLCGSAEHVIEVLAPLVAAGAPTVPQAMLREPDDDLFLDEDDLPATAEPDARPNADRAMAGAETLVPWLGPAPVRADELARQSGLSVRVVQAGLLELELAGRLERHGNGTVSLIA